MSNEELRPDFGLADNSLQACKNCKQALYNDAQAAYCMAGMAAGSEAEQGQRVNENFACANFQAK